MMLRTLKDKIRQKIISEYSNLSSKGSIEENEFREVVDQIIEDIIRREHPSLSDTDKKDMINELINEFLGFGPIENLLKDPTITEIMINGPNHIYVEREGKKELTDITFDNDKQLMEIIYKLLAPTRRRVDESFPYTEIALRDGSRVNIIIPPLVLDGPTVTIRKFLKEITTVEDLIRLGTLDKRMGDFLVTCVKAKVNIVFSGPTGVGKTTTLNVLSRYISNEERIITIEDTAELCLEQKHVVRLEARQPNIEGRGEVTIRDLFKNSLRMRPNRIILGEIRGAEALDMLQAICSGHKGSLSVIHAGSPEDVIDRIATMVLTSGVPITIEAIHRQIAAAINLIVQQEQSIDGSRKIVRIAQVSGLKNNEVIIEDIFVYEIESIDSENRVIGRWKAMGIIPVFYHLFEEKGINLPKEIFMV